jgi:hypothetical protein
MKRTKTFGAGRVCEGKSCTARLSIYNRDELCASCEEADRLEMHEAEGLERLLIQERNNDKSAARHLAGRRPRQKSAKRFYVGDGEFVESIVRKV